MQRTDDNYAKCDATTQEVYGRIRVALLDESTSNISLDVEDLFYNECIKSGLTLVSVAHRDSLRKFHQLNLELGLEDQHWRLSSIHSCDSESNSISYL